MYNIGVVVESGGKWEIMEQMFTGEYEHTVDEKGRLTIPAKFRPRLAGGMFVTKGLDGCLFVLPVDEWHAFSEKIRSLPLSRRNARLLSRSISSGTECKLDKQGRILLPSNLRKYAGIASDVVIVGVISRFEIWSKERWQEEEREMEEKSHVLAEQLDDLGIL